MSGALDVVEARELIRRETDATMDGANRPWTAHRREEEVERVIAAADVVDSRSEQPAITLAAFRATDFYKARMCARIEQLGERAATRVESMYKSPPWNGVLLPEEAQGRFAALVDGTCLGNA